MSATLWVVLVIALVSLGAGAYRLMKDHKHLVFTPIVVGALLLSSVLVGAVVGDDKTGDNDRRIVTAASCDTWPVKKANYGNTRWFADGVAQIDEARTEADARDAAEVWLNRVKQDPLLLSSAAKTFLDKDVSQVDLVDDGCGSETAVQTVMDIQTEIAKSKVSAVDSAPADSVTSGVENGQMVSLDTTGNDRAIEIIKPSGETVWIERDCGNVVTEYKHRKYPPSKRKPPRPRPTPPPPTTPPCVEIPGNGKYDCGQKDPSKSTLNNPRVDDWKTDGDDRHEVDEDSDGSEDSNGRQDNPREDAEEAEEEAEEETEEREEEHEEESSDDTEVDSEEDHGESEQPDW